MSWRDRLNKREALEVMFAEMYAHDFDHGTAGHNRLHLISKLASLLDKDPPSRRRVVDIIDAPYNSQHEEDAQRFRRDCGPNCVEIVGEYYRPDIDVTTDDIMNWITGGSDRSTYISELVRAANVFYGVSMARRENMSWEDLKQHIREGDPVIVLVHYGSFRTRMDRGYTKGHFMVVVGFDEVDYRGEVVERVVVHDPDFYGGLQAQGAFVPVVKDHFMAMWDDCHLDGNPVRTGIVRREP